MGLQVHLVDGTYELFRYYYALPDHINDEGMDVAATRGVVGTCLTLLEEGATHVGVATDHVIESFRNDLWPTYKDGSGVDPVLKAQFPLLEEALESAGFLVWAMVDCEADDALGAGAHQLKEDERVERVVICTPDKDMGQCVTDDGRVVQLDRRKGQFFDRAGVIEKFGVPPESIPDWLALVGDSADGFPGLTGWGAKSAGAVLAHYGHIEEIPPLADDWEVGVRGAGRLAQALRENLEDALLFRRIATLELDSITTSVEELEWTGPTKALVAMSERLDAPGLLERAVKLAEQRA
ncbi:MAG: 5'-3' exonuclease H3TH domain-containing protein [Acidimicrobiales bacterium]